MVKILSANHQALRWANIVIKLIWRAGEASFAGPPVAFYQGAAKGCAGGGFGGTAL
jgi:hypothetical protein